MKNNLACNRHFHALCIIVTTAKCNKNILFCSKIVRPEMAEKTILLPIGKSDRDIKTFLNVRRKMRISEEKLLRQRKSAATFHFVVHHVVTCLCECVGRCMRGKNLLFILSR